MISVPFHPGQVAREYFKGAKAAAPGAGVAVVTITAPGAGRYVIDVLVDIGGSVAAGDVGNMELWFNNAVQLAGLSKGSISVIADLNGTNDVIVKATGAATASTGYSAAIAATELV